MYIGNQYIQPNKELSNKYMDIAVEGDYPPARAHKG